MFCACTSSGWLQPWVAVLDRCAASRQGSVPGSQLLLSLVQSWGIMLLGSGFVIYITL